MVLRIVLLRLVLTIVVISAATDAIVLRPRDLLQKFSFSSHQEDVTGNYCGTSFSAASACQDACPAGVDSECPEGQTCFAGVTCAAPLPNICGANFSDAQALCEVACPQGVDSECPSGQRCFALVDCPVPAVSGSPEITSSPVPTPSASPAPTTSSKMSTTTTTTTTKDGASITTTLTTAEEKVGVNVTTTSINTTTVATATTTITSTLTIRTVAIGSNTKTKVVSTVTTTIGTVTTTSTTTNSTSNSITTTSTRTDLYCGTSWENAVELCANQCPNGVDADCPAGQRCYADVVCDTGGTSPPPTISTDPTNPLFISYYEQTWTPDTPFADATAGIAFSGWTDVPSALRDSLPKFDSLVGEKYLSLGGGNENGSWNKSGIAAVNKAIAAGDLDAYDGVCYDIEVGDAGLSPDFETSFAVAKNNGFKVLVTISHSAPYGISDGPAVMDSILSSANVDYVSPQLYTTGEESENDYDITSGYEWTNYADRTPKIVVSILNSAWYPDAVQTFATYGVSLSGYIIWP